MRLIRFLVLVLFFIFAILTLTRSGAAMNNPELIRWRASSFNDFALSAFNAVFGTEISQSDWAYVNRFRQNNNRLELFLALIGSERYENRYGYLEKKYSVWWKTRLIDTNSGRSVCHCYYHADFSHGGYIPNMQYIGKTLPAGNLNFGVARALVLFCAAFDKNTCPHFDCGIPTTSSSNNNKSHKNTNNNIYHPDYSPNKNNKTTDNGLMTEIRKNNWAGTWSVTSLHKTGPVKGRRYSSEFTVVISPNSNYVVWNKDRMNCVISGNALSFNGRHPSGGPMSFTFVRDGNTLVTNRCTFRGTINGIAAWGIYEGRKVSNH